MKKLVTLLLFAFSMLVIGSAFAKVEKFKVDNIRTEKVETVKVMPNDVLNEVENSVSIFDRTEDLAIFPTKAETDLNQPVAIKNAITFTRPEEDPTEDLNKRVIHEDPGR